MTGRYIFDNAQPGEHQRLLAMQDSYDPGTKRILKSRNIGQGWHCLEVGAGAGSIALWLAEHVSIDGRVVATDIDTTFLDDLTKPVNLEIWRHDIVVDPLPEGEFDLVHVRLLLDSLTQQVKALDQMLITLKPGGWIIAEEFDHITMEPDPAVGVAEANLFRNIRDALIKLWEPSGYDAYYGRKLIGQLRTMGLEGVGGETRGFVRVGGSPGSLPWRLSVEQKRTELVGAGFATAEDVENHLRHLDDPKFVYLSPLLVAAWGQRPLQ